MIVRARIVTVVMLVVLCLSSAALRAVDSTPTPTLYRIFLQDGTELVSYGEYARVGDRVVFSLPIGALQPHPQLRLMSIAISAIDWPRTEEYAEAVRARHYAATRGEDDFAMLSNRVAAALNEVAYTNDPARRLAMAEEARANLAEWPKQNYGYRASDVTQLLWLFDDVIAQLRAATGQTKFNLNLYAGTPPPPPRELLPPPDTRASFEMALTAARVAADATERISLLEAIAAALKPRSAEESWEGSIRERAAAELALERRITHVYEDLRSRMLGAAERRARRADVRGVQWLIENVHREDERIGRHRPQEVTALLNALGVRLDAARRLRLARDAWALRGGLLRRYGRAIAPVLAQLRRSRASLEDVRALAGPTPADLTTLERRMGAVRRRLAGIEVPAEAEGAHALLVSGAQIAARAAHTRRKAVESVDMAVAWEASSAAAGALMMFERATADINRLTSPPDSR